MSHLAIILSTKTDTVPKISKLIDITTDKLNIMNIMISSAKTIMSTLTDKYIIVDNLSAVGVNEYVILREKSSISMWYIEEQITKGYIYNVSDKINKWLGSIKFIPADLNNSDIVTRELAAKYQSNMQKLNEQRDQLSELLVKQLRFNWDLYTQIKTDNEVMADSNSEWVEFYNKNQNLYKKSDIQNSKKVNIQGKQSANLYNECIHQLKTFSKERLISKDERDYKERKRLITRS